MGALALTTVMILTFALGIAGARTLLDGVFYLMARNTAPQSQPGAASGQPTQSKAA
jgi:hypothetical protein